jgi:hypothetical protein
MSVPFPRVKLVKKTPDNHLLSPGSSAPALTKKSKQILEKFNFFCMVDDLMREVCSNFQIIWSSEQLSAKKINSGSAKKFTVHALF